MLVLIDLKKLFKHLDFIYDSIMKAFYVDLTKISQITVDDYDQVNMIINDRHIIVVFKDINIYDVNMFKEDIEQIIQILNSDKENPIDSIFTYMGLREYV